MDPRRTRPYKALARRVRAEESICWLCGHEIDRSLPYRDPGTGQVNTMSWSLDHVLPVEHRPDLALDRRNARAAHFGCNSGRGSRPPARPTKVEPLVTTRAW